MFSLKNKHRSLWLERKEMKRKRRQENGRNNDSQVISQQIANREGKEVMYVRKRDIHSIHTESFEKIIKKKQQQQKVKKTSWKLFYKLTMIIEAAMQGNSICQSQTSAGQAKGSKWLTIRSSSARPLTERPI